MIEVAENLGVVYETLKNLDLNGSGQRLVPTKENAPELLVLHDLSELIEPAKKEGSFSENLLKEILENDYRKKMKGGKSAVFYNYRKILAKPEYVAHLLALLNNSHFEITSN